jgi:hypothetical protein
MLWFLLIDEAERGLPPDQRFTASVFGLGRQNVWRIMKRHRKQYPESKLRRKLWYWQAAGALTILALTSLSFL